LEEETQKDGKPVKYIEVVNGGKGWATRDGERQELPASAIARTFDPQEGWGYKVILRLKDPQTVVTTIGDSVIGDHDVYGLKLTRSTGRTTIASRMWFDKKTWLLVRSEWLTNQANVLMEVNWDDYRMIDGIAVPHRATSKSFAAGGGGYTHVFSDFKFVDKFDPKLFDVP
jgi:hypothetical protein